MNFLNIGPLELLLIVAIAILVIGPQRMVDIIRTIGRLAGQARKLSGEFLSLIQAESLGTEVSEAKKKARETSEGIAEDLQKPITNIQSELATLEREARQALEKAVRGEEVKETTASIQAELQAAEQETRQALDKAVTGKAKKKPVSDWGGL